MILLNPPFFNILKNLVPCLALCWLISACSTSQLPELRPYPPESTIELENRCQNIFLQENSQLVHALEVQLPGKNRSSVIGITNVYPGERILESVIMSIEGLVLFHARYSEASKEIFKSIDPFTSEQFSDGLLQDIQLIFLKPGVNLVHSGVTMDGTDICRYTNKNEVVDILLLAKGNWVINQYDRKKLIKSIQASDINAKVKSALNRYPGKLVLTHTGVFGYSLEMKLIRAELTK